MDIRERIKKMASGEIDINEYTSNYQKKLREEQEEKLKQQRQQRNAERVQNIANRANETANTFKSNKINLPISKEFKQQLETGKRVQVPDKYSLPTFVDNMKKNQKGAIGYIGKRTGAGVLQGVTGIAQAGTTEVASNIEKGNKKSGSQLISDTINAIGGILNPTQVYTEAMKNVPNLISNTVKTLTDKNKTGLEKATSVVTNAVSEASNNNSAKKMFNTGIQILGKVTPENTSEKVLEFNDKISQPVERLNAQLEAERNNYGQLIQTIGDVGQTVGNMVPAMVGTAVTKNPTVGLATMGVSTKGQATQEALNKGATLDEAIKIGDTKAVIEVGTEMLTGGVNIFGKGALDDIVERGIVSKVKNNVAKKLVQQGVNVTGEVLEETISDVLGTTIDKGTVDPNASYSIEDWGDTALTTVLSTLVLNAISGVGNIKRNKNDKQVQQKLQEAQDIINNVQNEPINTPTQQITGQQNKMAQNGTSSQLNDILNNKDLPMQSYQYEKSDNVKINNLRQDANRYFNNSEQAHNYVSMLEQIITDKNIDIRLDSNLKTADGRIVNGSYSNGIITINPNSTRTGEFIAIHELTHAIGTKEMLNMVNAYRQSNAEFDNAVKGLLQNYQSTEITEEALADISGQLFGNQEFINSIAQKNPNIFQKIYSEIKYLWHQFRGYKNQNQFVEDLYYKWTQAYNSNNKLNETSKYSIAGRNAKNANINKLSEAVKLEEQGKSAQEIYEETGWYRGNESKWRFEIDDNNFNILSDIEIEANRAYELHEIMNADKLYDAYPDLYNTEVVFMDLNEKSGYYDVTNDVIYLNNNLIKNTDAKSYEMLGLHNQSELFSVLNHEIQHWIQHYEDFSNGSNAEYWEKINKNKREKTKRIERDLTYYQEKIGYKEYQEKQLDKMLNKEITGEEYIKNLEEFINNSENAEEINKLKEMYDKSYPHRYADELYRNTAGEQEARDVQNRIKLSSEEKKQRLPFVKDKFTVYAEKSKENYHVSENFSNEIDKALNNQLQSNTQVKARNYTPQILVDNGVENLPMLITQKHIKSTIYTLQEAEKLGLPTKNVNYHGLGKDLLIKAIDNLDNPQAIYKTDENNYLVVTEFKDNNGKEIIVPIQINAKGRYNDVFIDENQIKSVYGRNNLDNYINKNNFEQIYKKNKELDFNEGIRYSNVANSFINNSIPSQKKDVNTTTKYSIQESENNSGSFNLPKNKINKLTDKGIVMTYVRNPNTQTANYGTTYGQNLEPAGEYMSMDTMQGEYKIPGFEYGTIEFGNPLVIEHKDTTANGWKKDLSERYNGLTGRKLSEAIKKDGYDAIMTQDVEGNFIEIVNLNGKKGLRQNSNRRYSVQETQNNTTWQQYLDKNYKTTGTRTSMQDILPTKEYFENRDSTKNNKSNASNNIQNINNLTNIEEPKTIELPNNNREKVKQNKIAKILNDPIKNQKPTQRTWAILQANLIDKGAVFETLSLKTKNRELQAKYDAILSSGSKGQYAIGNDRYTFENGKQTLQSKSLASIIDEVGENTTDFYNYMYHQLNIDRMTLEERFNGDTGTNYERKEGIKNKPVFGEEITAEYSKQKVAEYEEQYPEFKSYAQDVYDFLDANKKELVDSGVISQELSDKFKEMYPHYVPIARVDKSNNSIQVPLDTKRTGINSPIKKAKGGSQDIQPMFHTIADRTLQTYRASARNAFGVELKNTLEKNNLLNSINEDTDIDTIIDTMADEQQTGLTEGTKYTNPTFTVFENGKKVTYDINQDMYEALKPQNELITKINNSKLSKIVNKISNIRRGVLTEYNPLFSITNSIKDAQDVLQNSQHAVQTYKKFPEAYAQIVKKGYWYNEYIQNGGEQNSYFKDGDFKLNTNLPRGKKIITLPIRTISKVNSVIEMAPRLAEYIASRENGSSIETSMLDASRVTTNFKAGGDITKFANRNGFTFLNAGVQGMAQQIRNIREANAKGLKGYAVLTAKTILAGIPALILNNLIWGDDEDYDELQDYVKDGYYIVGKIGEHQFIRIPKGRTTAVIQKLFTTANKYITKEKEINIDNFAEDFWANLVFAKDNIAPNNPIDNNIISPLVQVTRNKTWYGDDLVPTRLQDVPKAEQYDETTDKFSKWLGQTLNISPIKINYLLDQYGGGISDVLLPLGTPQAENSAVEDKFTTNSVMKSKYPGEFFEKSDELKVKSNSEKATDEDKLKYKYFSSVSEETSKLYKKKREIQNSTLTDTEKKKQILEVQKQINSVEKEALETVEKINVNENTATIGENKYYKTTDVKDKTKTWKELSKEEIEKNKNIPLNTYADYKEKIAQETIKQRKNGTIKEDASLKDKDKILILLNSGYSNKEKQELYENYIKSKNDTEYPVIKTAGIDITQYLKYKQQEFTSDKKDDGTLTGKTVSKSKQKKVVEYLNSMKITGNQRLLLYAMQGYTTTSSQKTQLANYVQGLTLNKEDKLKLYDKFSGFTVYKNGRVTW